MIILTVQWDLIKQWYWVVHTYLADYEFGWDNYTKLSAVPIIAQCAWQSDNACCIISVFVSIISVFVSNNRISLMNQPPFFWNHRLSTLVMKSFQNGMLIAHKTNGM